MLCDHWQPMRQAVCFIFLKIKVDPSLILYCDGMVRSYQILNIQLFITVYILLYIIF